MFIKLHQDKIETWINIHHIRSITRGDGKYGSQITFSVNVTEFFDEDPDSILSNVINIQNGSSWIKEVERPTNGKARAQVRK